MQMNLPVCLEHLTSTDRHSQLRCYYLKRRQWKKNCVCLFITVRKRSYYSCTCLSVILFTGGVCPGVVVAWVQGGGGVQAQAQGGVSQHAFRQTPPADGYCCGRYAFYWNAFLLAKLFHKPLCLSNENGQKRHWSLMLSIILIEPQLVLQHWHQRIVFDEIRGHKDSSST